MDEQLIVIREYETMNRAEVARSFLDMEGIYATIRNEYISCIDLPAQVVVREEDAEWASALLTALEQ
jgi:hypothetical protein